MIFKKDFLQEMGGETISEKIIDNTRWSLVYERIFKHDGRFYVTTYRTGATEMQDEDPYEYEKDEIECAEVKPTKKTITVYV